MNPRQNMIGIDIGGANLKFVSEHGESRSVFFPMWQQHDRLAEALVDNLRRMEPSSQLAVTMTGELADCFFDRGEGVHHIVSQTDAATDQLHLPKAMYYGVDGNFHLSNDAIKNVDVIAAANWHALASYVATIHPNCLLIDIGSTTTDIIPIENGQVATSARTDFQRLLEGSLVYVGCKRTTACGLVNTLSYRGDRVPVMNENFATMDDAMLVLDLGTESPDRDTADGRPRTKHDATNRIARMIGLDHRHFNANDAEVAAKELIAAARSVIQAAIGKITRGMIPKRIIISGHGSSLVEIADQTEVVDLNCTLGSDVARSAPAFAVMWLLQKAQSKSGTTI